MALPASFSLLHSELNDFLFATLGKEENGVPLSVLSALTRLDIDPWAEGSRLAELPKEAAVRALTPLIAVFPEEHRSPAQVRDIAVRLAALLPEPPAVALATAAAPQARRRSRPQFWLALAAILALAAMGLRGLFF